MREEKGREQALCVRRRRTKSGALRLWKPPLLPIPYSGSIRKYRMLCCNRAGARSWETALPRLFVGGLPCPLSQPTWSISAFFLRLPSKSLFLPLATETLPLYRLLYGTVCYYTAFSKTQLNHSSRNQTAAREEALHNLVFTIPTALKHTRTSQRSSIFVFFFF